MKSVGKEWHGEDGRKWGRFGGVDVPWAERSAKGDGARLG